MGRWWWRRWCCCVVVVVEHVSPRGPFHPMQARTRPSVVCLVVASRSQVHSVIANVEANFLTGISTTLIKDMAAPLLEVDAAVMADPKVGSAGSLIAFRSPVASVGRNIGSLVLAALLRQKKEGKKSRRWNLAAVRDRVPPPRICNGIPYIYSPRLLARPGATTPSTKNCFFLLALLLCVTGWVHSR